MIYDKTTQIFIVFIINRKNTINTIYLVMFLNTIYLVFYFEPKWYTGGVFLPNGTNVVNFSIRTILQ